jgi:hypothetical protein
MARVVMLLPKPDNLRLANCHKYVTRRDDKAYSEVYTMTTIKGQCSQVDKVHVIGHGNVGSFQGATIDQVADAIIDSGIPLTGGKAVAFDTCYAGTGVNSALHLVKAWLKSRKPKCNLSLAGATGCSVTIGSFGYSVSLSCFGAVGLSYFGGADKRLVIKPDRTDNAEEARNRLVKEHAVDLSGHRKDWAEGTPSATIKVWAQQEYSKLIEFAIEFRAAPGGDLETGAERKVKINVQDK